MDDMKNKIEARRGTHSTHLHERFRSVHLNVQYCPGCGHEFLLDNFFSNVGRDVSNLDFQVSAAPNALLI